MVYAKEGKVVNLAIGTAHGRIRHILTEAADKLVYKCTWLPEHFLPREFTNSSAFFYSREYSIDELDWDEILRYYYHPYESESLRVDGNQVLVCVSKSQNIWFSYDKVQFELNAFIMKDIIEYRYVYAEVSFYYPDQIEFRFNPYHDPNNGRFISGPSGFSGICLVKAKEGTGYEEYDGKYVRLEKGQIVEVVEYYVPESQKTESMTEQEIIESYKARNVTHLSDTERKQVRDDTGWPDEIIDYIEDMEQYEVYKTAALQYALVNGRPCLVKDIDLDYVDPGLGLINRELLKKGQAPYDHKSGMRIVIHHMRQEHNAPFVELTEEEHKNSVLHKHNNDPSASEIWISLR